MPPLPPPPSRLLHRARLLTTRSFGRPILTLVLLTGCSHPDCDWDHTSFTSDKIANLQARIEAQTGSSSLKFCSDPAVLLAQAAGAGGAAAAAAAASGSSAAAAAGSAGSNPSLSLGGGHAFTGGAASANGSTGGASGGAHSKRKLDLGKDEDAGQTPSPRLRKLKRSAKPRMAATSGGGGGGGGGGVESTPTGDGIGSSK